VHTEQNGQHLSEVTRLVTDLLLFRRIRKKKRRQMRVQAQAGLRRGIADCYAGRLLTREEMWRD